MPLELRSRTIPSTPLDTQSEGVSSSLLGIPGRRRRTQTASSGAAVGVGHRVAAWLVHLYTGLGLPLNILSVHALYFRNDFERFCLLNWLAVFVDATDGTLARRVDVKRATPNFDGAALDNIVDYLTFAFLPALAIVAFDLVPDRQLQLTLAVFVTMASGYQFCQKVAKTTESFVGFPSYWNILLFYIYYLRPRVSIVVFFYVSCSILSFVPIHFVYPSRTKPMQRTTLTLATVWVCLMNAPVIAPKWPYSQLMMKVSCLYVVYYVILSLVLHFRRSKAAAP